MTGGPTEAAIAPAHHLVAAHPPVTVGQSSGIAAAAAMLPLTSHHAPLLTGSLTAGGRAARERSTGGALSPSRSDDAYAPFAKVLLHSSLFCMLCCIYCPAKYVFRQGAVAQLSPACFAVCATQQNRLSIIAMHAGVGV